ncbi:MAG: ACT domain-containing protein [bacterium]|nr:ACT domain-containing protein [bacterium]
MTQTAVDALKGARLVSDGSLYALVKLPPNAITAAAGVIAEISEPFAMLMIDAYEVTLVLQVDDFEDYKRRLPGHEISPVFYRLITFDGELSPDLVGFMARIAAVLAEANVWILPLGAYTRDHVLVKAHDHETAMKALEQMLEKLKAS